MNKLKLDHDDLWALIRKEMRLLKYNDEALRSVAVPIAKRILELAQKLDNG